MQGRLGLELAREHFPDLILLDLHLPDIAGDEVLNRLRVDPCLCAIPVVAMSADGTVPQSVSPHLTHAHTYLTRPLNVKKFLQTMEETLQ